VARVYEEYANEHVDKVRPYEIDLPPHQGDSRLQLIIALNGIQIPMSGSPPIALCPPE
jgi:hypothetical protein